MFEGKRGNEMFSEEIEMFSVPVIQKLHHHTTEWAHYISCSEAGFSQQNHFILALTASAVILVNQCIVLAKQCNILQVTSATF